MEQYISGSRYGEGLDKLKPYIDVEGAIAKIGGSIDVYNRLIVTYYNQNAAAIDELYDKIGRDARGFKTKIHSIRTNSASVGANELSKEASRLEAAINIGNREYVKDNIEGFTDDLLDVLLAIEEYVSYMDSVSGMSDEEYAEQKAKEREQREEKHTDDNQDSIDMSLLEILVTDSKNGYYESVIKTIELIDSKRYMGEDAEFIVVLKEAVDKRDSAMISELVTTYFDLKR